MEEGIVREWDSRYTQKTKHRKRCRGCNRIIADGESVHFVQSRKWHTSFTNAKHYPKVHTYCYHSECFVETRAQAHATA